MVGRAGVILDNLIAAAKARPMIVDRPSPPNSAGRHGTVLAECNVRYPSTVQRPER